MKKFYMLIASVLVISMSTFGKEIEALKQSEKTKISLPGTMNTSNANPIPKGKIVFTVKTQSFENNEIYSGNNKIENPENKSNEVFNNTFIMRYGLSEKFSFKANIPLISKELHMTKTKASETIIKNTGFGDLKTFLGYSIKSQKKGDKYSALLEFGLTLPTGESNKTFNINTAKGVIESKSPYGIQLGDGSVDTTFKITLSKNLKDSRVDFSTDYTINNEGDHNVKFGNELNYNFAYIKGFSPKFSVFTELNGKYSDKNEVNGVKEDNSGGSILYLTPGIVYKAMNNLALMAAVQLPIYRDLNGEQLLSDYRLQTKISYSIN